MSRHSPAPVGDVLVRYSAAEMPTTALIDYQRQTVEDLRAGEIKQSDALRIVNLLLTIALQKLEAMG